MSRRETRGSLAAVPAGKSLCNIALVAGQDIDAEHAVTPEQRQRRGFPVDGDGGGDTILLWY
jgi:hypothetical protein